MKKRNKTSKTIIGASFCLALFAILTGCAQLSGGSGSSAGGNTPPAVKVSKSAEFKEGDIKKVAVIVDDKTLNVIANHRNKEQLKAVLDEPFQSALLGKGYDVADRSNVEIIAKEQSFQASGFTKEQLMKFSEAIGCEAIIVVKLVNYNETKSQSIWTVNGQRQYNYAYSTSMQAKLINKENALLWSGSLVLPNEAGKKYENKEDPFEVITACAEYIAESFPATQTK